ncbi:RNA polymerase sigma factor [Peijinzhouia sedimentorum]
MNLTTTFEELHKQYQPMVMQLCLGFVKGEIDQAKDLSQEIFINVWNALEKFEGKSSYKTWIYRISINTCLLHIRKHKKAINIPLEKVSVELQNSTEVDKNYASLYQAIGKLGEIDRLTIMLVLDELSYDEIAEIMGINPTNLRVKIHRIKKKLKELLQDERA